MIYLPRRSVGRGNGGVPRKYLFLAVMRAQAEETGRCGVALGTTTMRTTPAAPTATGTTTTTVTTTTVVGWWSPTFLIPAGNAAGQSTG